MKPRCSRYWRSPRGGLTLVETLAGSAILGAMLVSVLLASGRLSQQARRTERRLEACRIADDLLAGWWPRASQIQRMADGEVPGHAGWRWRTQPVRNDQARALRGEAVAVEILAPDRTDDEFPAARVEILLPAAED